MTPVRLKPAAPWSRVKHSTTEPLHSPAGYVNSRCYNFLRHYCYREYCIRPQMHTCSYKLRLSTLLFIHTTEDVLKFRTLVACPKCLDIRI